MKGDPSQRSLSLRKRYFKNSVRQRVVTINPTPFLPSCFSGPVSSSCQLTLIRRLNLSSQAPSSVSRHLFVVNTNLPLSKKIFQSLLPSWVFVVCLMIYSSEEGVVSWDWKWRMPEKYLAGYLKRIKHTCWGKGFCSIHSECIPPSNRSVKLTVCLLRSFVSVFFLFLFPLNLLKDNMCSHKTLETSNSSPHE